ncbi:antibiotic biosynthesis monooxygenase [Chloroflexi bacterium CFX6]|nr:antibiotic biosynthesis monooxygenase [Chloroflexi bacterium CFX6]
MPIKTIVELAAKPGERSDLLRALDDVLASMKNAPGFLGAKRYEIIDDPDSLIEIAEWESPEARQRWLERSMKTGALNRLTLRLGAPFKAITIREIG